MNKLINIIRLALISTTVLTAAASAAGSSDPCAGMKTPDAIMQVVNQFVSPPYVLSLGLTTEQEEQQLNLCMSDYYNLQYQNNIMPYVDATSTYSNPPLPLTVAINSTQSNGSFGAMASNNYNSANVAQLESNSGTLKQASYLQDDQVKPAKVNKKAFSWLN
jgi:hypothetical protein